MRNPKKISLLVLTLTLLFSLSGCYTSLDNLTLPNFPLITEDELQSTDSTQYHSWFTSPEILETEPPIPPTDPVMTQAPTPLPTEPLFIPTEPRAEPSNEDFVLVTDYIPDAVTDLRYATDNNFTGQVIYDFSSPWLRYGTVKKLMMVQTELAKNGYRLKIWDAFRPTAAQFRLWEICPDSTYVANPYNGFSSHSRGNTVDITIVHADGTEVQMPTGFDDFSTLADRDYSDCSTEAASNAAYLEGVMRQNGFSGYYGEWWHFTDCDSYPVEQNFHPAEKE